MDTGITKTERTELLSLVKSRAKLAKAEVDGRKAELLADFEQTLAAKYKPADHPVWEEAHKAVQTAAQEADVKVAEVCRTLGIPDQFRPSIITGWSPRGENSLKDYRIELRKVAKTWLDAEAQKAKLAIDSKSVDMQAQLVSGGLQSDEAKLFLESMPTAQELMVPLVLPEIESSPQLPRASVYGIQY